MKDKTYRQYLLMTEHDELQDFCQKLQTTCVIKTQGTVQAEKDSKTARVLKALKAPKK